MVSILNIVLFILAVLGITYVIGGYTESFIPRGDYPYSQDNPLLSPDYPVKSNPSLSDYTSSKLSQEQPRTPMSSYAQETNNFRYWENPNNGLCSPGDFCNAIYNNKKISIPSVYPPTDTGGTRVNYYNSL
jgi:hypothetical protein